MPEEDVLDAMGGPLFMQSGMQEAPPYSPPIGYEEMSPHERAAYRVRGGPPANPPRQPTLEENAQGALMMVPGGPIVRGITMAPKISMATLAAMGLLGTAGQAGENEFRPPVNKNLEAEITRIEQAINNMTSRADRITGSQGKAKGGNYVKQLAADAQANNAQLAEANAQLKALKEQRTAEYNDAFTKWQTQEAERIKSEKPFREEFPNAYRYGVPAAWLLSALGGGLASKVGAPVKSAVGGAMGGSLASGFMGVAPTVYDSATLPRGSKFQAEAQARLQDPNFWALSVGPEVLAGSLAGAAGGKYGGMMKEGVANVGRRVKDSTSRIFSGMGGRSAAPTPPATAATPGQSAAPQASRAPVDPNETLIREYETMTAKGYQLNEDLSKMYGRLIWFKAPAGAH